MALIGSLLTMLVVSTFLTSCNVVLAFCNVFPSYILLFYNGDSLWQTLILPCLCYLSILRGKIDVFQVGRAVTRSPKISCRSCSFSYKHESRALFFMLYRSLKHHFRFSFSCICCSVLQGSMCTLVIGVGVVSAAFGSYSALSQIVQNLTS